MREALGQSRDEHDDDVGDREDTPDAPGIDCGACGAPSCRAFAEDIVRGIAGDRICPVMSMRQADNRKSDKEDPE